MEKLECPYCGMFVEPPLNYHEGAGDCQRQMQDMAPRLKKLMAAGVLMEKVLIGSQPFTSNWEFNPFDFSIDSEGIHKKLCELLEVKPKEDIVLEVKKREEDSVR